MSVTVILPDNKRINIKVTFNSLLSEVLEKVCAHKGLNSNNYTLQRGNKALDLGLSLRLANVPLNSEVNLVFDANKKANQQVSLSVQFEDRQRRTGQFTSEDTLWHVIETLFAADCPEIADDNLVLSINFMNRQFEGRETLSSTTLKLIGILSGRQMLRMNSRSKGAQKSTQKFVENIQFKKAESLTTKPSAPEPEPPMAIKSEPKADSPSGPMDLSATASAQNEGKSGSSQTTSNKGEGSQGRSLLSDPANKESTGKKASGGAAAQRATNSSATDADTTSVNLDLLRQVKYLGGQHEEILYSFADSPQFVEENVSDDFFEHTTSDLKHLLNQLKRQRTGMSEAQLETQKTREERERLERQKYEQTIIRVVFPYDRLILQGLFAPTHTVKEVLGVLQRYTDHPEQLYLFTAPPKTVLPTGASLFDLKLVPSGLMYCGSNSTLPVIKQQYKEQQVNSYSVAANLSLHQMKSIYLKSKVEKKP